MYKAVVTKIHVRPFPGADRIQIGTCGQYQVIVGIDIKDGDLGVFFEQDGQLDESFAKQNDLVRRKNEDGSPAGGMFEESRRVKAIKLRGVKSEGFWCPVSSFGYTGGIDSLVEGLQFSEINGHKICDKYVTKATQAKRGSRKTVQRDNKMFAKHVDTGHFRREAGTIPADSFCYMTEKLHGTSFRYANVLDDVPIVRGKLWGAIAKAVGLPSSEKKWRHIVGSRNVILEHREGFGFYGEEAFRHKCVEGIALHKGEVIYGEIVGFTESGAPIMGTQGTEGLKDKSIKSLYGDKMVYSYGCLPSQCKTFVYRITQVNEDGYSVDLSWLQVKKRCRELGIQHVPEVGNPVCIAALGLQVFTDYVAEKTEAPDGKPYPSSLDSRHIQEGVVVRWESEHGTGWLKSKSFTFGILEGYLKDTEDYVDAEETA